MNWLFLLWSGIAAAEQGDIDIDSETVDELPNIYYVQPGDKLWTIAEKYMGEGTYWPELWAYNQYISNPHWIYPKDDNHKGEIVFKMGTLIEPPQVEIDQGYQVKQVKFEPTDATCGPDVKFDFQFKEAMYTVPGFLAHKKDLNVVGRVAKAKKNQSFLLERDIIYLEVNDINAYECGSVLTIFRRTKKRVRHPDSYWTDYGGLYRIVGEAKVVHRFGKYLTASVRTSYTEIARGDLVGPELPVIVHTNVNTPKGELQGTVIEHLSQRHMLNIDRETVFIDKGESDGVEVGDTFYVIRQRDSYYRNAKHDPELPPSVVGRILVIKVDNKSSVAVITDAAESIEIGDIISEVVY